MRHCFLTRTKQCLEHAEPNLYLQGTILDKTHRHLHFLARLMEINQHFAISEDTTPTETLRYFLSRDSHNQKEKGPLVGNIK
jgi:hypothetical protein